MNEPSKECRRCHEAIALMVGGVLPEAASAGVKEHLERCPDCQRHADELRTLGENLRRMAAMPVEPRPGFEPRWRAAVHSTPQGGGFAESLWLFVRRNRRPLLAFAPVWVLILAFRLAAPEVSSLHASATARSPMEVARALRVPVVFAGHGEFDGGVEVKRPAQPRPRSEVSPADSVWPRRWVNRSQPGAAIS